MRHYGLALRLSRTPGALVPRAVILVAALSLAVPASPVTVSVTVYPGWNMISFAGAPFAPSVPDVFSAYSDDGATGAEAVDGKLSHWNPLLDSLIGWDTFAIGWGGILPSDGYWLFREDATSANVSVQALDVSADQWISLPVGTHWNLIGYPNYSPTSTDFVDLQVTNGIDTLSYEDAVAEGWISDVAYRFVNPPGSTRSAGIPSAFPYYETLDRAAGYQIQAYVDNLALIIPGQ